MDECRQHLKHLNPEHVQMVEANTDFFLEEKSASGAGKAYFRSSGPCVVIKTSPTGPLLWALKNKKIGEGAVLTQDDQGYHLHILEMKSKLSHAEWSKALLQFEGMFLTTLALVRVLGVTEVASVTCYIAYKQNAMSVEKSADLVLLKTFVGMANPVGGGNEWSSGKVDLPLTGPATIRKAQRDDSANADFGLIN